MPKSLVSPAQIAAIQNAVGILIAQAAPSAVPVIQAFFGKLVGRPEAIVVFNKVLDFVGEDIFSPGTWRDSFRMALAEYSVERLVRETLKMSPFRANAKRPKDMNASDWKNLRQKARDQTA